MANLDDILANKSSTEDESSPIDIGGICEVCFYPLDHGFYDEKRKKLRIVCTQGHERIIDWDMNG